MTFPGYADKHIFIHCQIHFHFVFHNFQSSSLEFQKDIWKREQIFRHNKLTSSVGFFQTKQKSFSIRILACLYYVFLLCSIHNQDAQKKKSLNCWVFSCFQSGTSVFQPYPLHSPPYPVHDQAFPLMKKISVAYGTYDACWVHFTQGPVSSKLLTLPCHL